MMRQTILVLIALLCLVGCSNPLTQSDIAKSSEAKFLQDATNKLAAHDFASLKGLLDPSVNQPDVDKALSDTAAALPSADPASINFVTWTVTTSTTSQGTVRIVNLSAEYAYPDNKWVLISATLKGESESLKLLAFNVSPLPRPLAEINAFTFAGKGPLHYVFLVLAVGAVCLCVGTFILAIRTPNIRWKWLWAIFCLIGVCQFSLNWTTGATNIMPSHIALLSAGFSSKGFGMPWTISWSVPIGAFAFLIKRWRLTSSQSG